MKPHPDKSPNPAQAGRVLVAVDFSPDSQRALEAGLEFIGPRAVDLHLVHVHVPFEEGDLTSTQESALQAEMEHMYQKATASHLVADDTVVTYSVERDIAPAAAVLRYAASHGIDLLVAGTHGRRGFRRLILGSVAEEVVRLSPTAVLTIGGTTNYRLGLETKSIMVPIDFSEESSKTLAAARVMGEAYGADLDILHVVEEAVHPAFYNTGVFSVYDLRPDLDRKALEELEKLYKSVDGPDVPVTFALRQGHAAKEIVSYAKEQESDMIVMSTHGLTGLTHVLIGSVAETVVRTAPCPVLILPREEAVSSRNDAVKQEEVAA